MSKKQLEDWLNEANVVFNYRFDYSKVIFTDRDVEVTISCKDHGDFNYPLRAHSRSAYGGCPECNQEVRKGAWLLKANIIHRKKFDYSSVEYKDFNTEVKIKCPNHGYFYCTPSSHIGSKHGCKQCDLEEKKVRWVAKSNKKHKYKFDYSEAKYLGFDDPVNIVCPLHGSFISSPHKHLHSTYGCPTCANIYVGKKRAMSTEKWVDIASTIHNGRYDYSISVFGGSNKPINIICKLHGEFTQSTASSHLGGHGCPLCSRYTNDEWVQKAMVVHGDTYDYSESYYISSDKPIDIICKKHGKFTQASAAHHIQGKGCGVCGNEKRYGKTNPNYKDGKCLNRQSERNTPEARIWVRAIKEITTTCDCCGDAFSKYNIAHAHHLNSWISHTNERYNVNNGVALCGDCHHEFHNIYGLGYNTKEQYYQFKQVKNIELGA